MAEDEKPDYDCWLVIATTIFLSWTVIFTGVRAWAKLRRSIAWALYDNFFTSAFVLAVAQCACTYLAAHYGFGKPPGDLSSENELHLKKTLYASQILYVLSIGVSKISTILLLNTLTRDEFQKRISLGITVLISCWLIASVFAIALRGNLSAPWQAVYGHEGLFIRWLAIECSGLVLEVVMWCVSVGLVWGLNMPMHKRLKVVGIFGFRLLLIPIVATRLLFLSQGKGLASLNADTLAEVLTQGGMQYSLMAECMTCLKPFLHPFHSSYGWSTADAAVLARYGTGSISANPKREVYGDLSNASQSRLDSETKGPAPFSMSSKRGGLRRSHASEEEFRFRSDNVSYSTNVGWDSKARKPMSEDDIELLHGSNGRIQQTRTFEVTGDTIPTQNR